MISIDIDSYDFRYTFPREFVCHYAESRHTIYALVEQCADQPFLEKILTCKDENAAELATYLLNLAMNEGRTKLTVACAEHVTTLLPDSPAASLRERLAQLYNLEWPLITDTRGGSWGQLATVENRVGKDPERDRKLAEFRGPVVRVAKLYEFHITDPDRVLMAALAQDWGPRDEEDRDPDDPNDVRGAAWWLIRNAPDRTIPGMETLYGESGQSIFWQLFEEDGEEVAGWRKHGIHVTFETGEFRDQERKGSKGKQPS